MVLVGNRLRPRAYLFIGGEISPALTTSFVQKSPARQISGSGSGSGSGSYMRDICKSILQFFTVHDRGAGHSGRDGNGRNLEMSAMEERWIPTEHPLGDPGTQLNVFCPLKLISLFN